MIRPIVSALVFALVAASGRSAPPAVPSVAELDIPYSAANPPGPSFTAEEKRRQVVDGQRIRREIVAAFKAGRESYTIPPGDYRFESAYRSVRGEAFALQGLDGDPAKPFRVLGYGATLWFTLTDHPAPHHHEMIKIFECSHISLEGVTVDSDPRGCMDATITAFDFERNRIQVKPVAGTRLITQMPSSEHRFIPYKANGRHIAALYRIDEGWGPGNVLYDSFDRTEDGLYWLTMKSTKLLDTVKNAAWRSVYGSEGTLEIGDMLGIVYSSASAITLLNCKQITIRDCRFHAAKAGLVERDGYGDHRWINCHFMARPGTNNLLGGDGAMSSCMHGSTFDGRVVQRTTDDCCNSHGHYRHAERVTERSITFREAPPPDLAPGHTADAYEMKTDSFIGRLTVEGVDGKTVTFREDIGERYATAAVMFTAFQNAGWVIRNSTYSDCYQRLRLMCGPGIFENNRVERIGGGLTLENGRAADIEGGQAHGVVIRNNVFIDSAVAPPMHTLSAKGRRGDLTNLEVSGNLVCNSGSEAVHVTRADGLVLRDNIIVHPALGESLMPKGKAARPGPAAVVLEDVREATLKGNLLVRGSAGCDLIRQSGCERVSLEGNRDQGDPQRQFEDMIRHLTDTHSLSASEIIVKVRSAIDGDGSPDQ